MMMIMGRVLISLLLLLLICCGREGAFEARTTELEMEIVALRIQLEAVNQQLDRLEAEMGQIEDLEARLAAITSERDELRARFHLDDPAPPSP